MDAHLQRLENDVAAIRADTAELRVNMATKADLSAMASRLIKWIVGTALAVCIAEIAAAFFLLAYMVSAVSRIAAAPAVAIVLTPSHGNQK